MGFLSHSSGSRYARRSIKGSNDADDRLVSKQTLSQKMARWVGAQGQVKLFKTENPPKNIFSSKPEDLPKPPQKIFSSKPEDLPNP